MPQDFTIFTMFDRLRAVGEVWKSLSQEPLDVERPHQKGSVKFRLVKLPASRGTPSVASPRIPTDSHSRSESLAIRKPKEGGHATKTFRIQLCW